MLGGPTRLTLILLPQPLRSSVTRRVTREPKHKASLRKIHSKPLKSLERVKGIEPSYSAWKAAALPLSYTRVLANKTGHSLHF
jgi:hypothetical protein